MKQKISSSSAVVILVFLIFFVEFGIMLLLPELLDLHLNNFDDTLIYSFTLSLLLIPGIWYLVIVPIKENLREIEEDRKTIQIAHQKLFRRKEEFKTLISKHSEGIMIIDSTGKCVLANDSAMAMFGRKKDELENKLLGLPLVKDKFVKINLMHAGNSPRSAELRSMEIQWNNEPAALVMLRDTTEQERLQVQVIQSDRMANMGMLAGGVAHEINNPLTYTMLNLESAGDILQNTPSAEQTIEARQLITDAISGVQRVAKIVKGVRVLAQVNNKEMLLIDFNRPLEIALLMATNEIKYRAKIHKEFSNSLFLLSNEGQLAQVFLNLLINAAHSIQEGDIEHNSISLKTWREGDEIFASVTDTGSGIEEKHITKIFEPFFTTSPSKIGNGLGLAIPQNIIHSLGGRIEVQSTAGKGTTMLVRLPAHLAATSSIHAEEVGLPIESVANKITGRFLVIDDEAEIRKSISRVLVGCSVIEADSPESAQNILRNDREFALILCDIDMTTPKISGMDLFDWLEKEHPALVNKIIFITGGAFTDRAQAILNKVGVRKLEKPFTGEDLIKLLKHSLQA